MRKWLGIDLAQFGSVCEVNMGQMEESNMKTEAMEDHEKLIGEGNDAFKARNYEETLSKLWMTVQLLMKLVRIIKKHLAGCARLLKLWTRLNRLILMQKLFTTKILETGLYSLFYFISCSMPRLMRCPL